MVSITPLNSRFSTEAQTIDGGSVNTQLLCIDLHADELWKSSFEDANHLKALETKWGSLLSNIKDVVIKRHSEENLEDSI
ncbi:hypothetical protein HanPI659440_Chr14g0570911 [Helianthus annuus]|nr:hypothetical protein HanPI659440_Chr14g0570911 [Helianthus annuus]